MTQQQLVEAVPVVMLRSIPETLLLGVCVHASNQIFRLVQGRHGLPIFSTFLGVIVSSGLTYLTGLTSDILYEIGADIVLIIGIVVLVRVIFGIHGRSVFGISRIFVIFIDALLGIIVCAHICFLLMVSLGYYGSPQKALGSFLILTGIVLLAAVLRYIVSLGEDSFD